MSHLHSRDRFFFAGGSVANASFTTLFSLSLLFPPSHHLSSQALQVRYCPTGQRGITPLVIDVTCCSLQSMRVACVRCGYLEGPATPQLLRERAHHARARYFPAICPGFTTRSLPRRLVLASVLSREETRREFRLQPQRSALDAGHIDVRSFPLH